MYGSCNNIYTNNIGDLLKKNIINIFLIILICIALFSFYNIINHKIDSINTNNEIRILQNNTIINSIDKDDVNYIDINFDNLINDNKDTVGWIQVNGTNINYPFVQTNNNDFYLKHSFDKSYNSSGWIFLDYRNNISNNYDKNTIIYGHGRLDNTMFGSLRNTLSEDWLNNKDNHIIKISTIYNNSLWEVFSVYHIPTTSDYLNISFIDDNEYKLFLNMLLNRSIYNFNTNVDVNDKILTLSTCYNDKDKIVVHAKLIKTI